jgi:cobalt/nickel transport protein
MIKSQKRLWIGLLLLALLSPLGVLLPEKFKAGGAWGEWGPKELEKLIGYVPDGLRRWADFWKAPVPDYNFSGEKASLTTQVLSYLVSGLIGVLVVGLVIYLIAKVIVRNEK